MTILVLRGFLQRELFGPPIVASWRDRRGDESNCLSFDPGSSGFPHPPVSTVERPKFQYDLSGFSERILVAAERFKPCPIPVHDLAIVLRFRSRAGVILPLAVVNISSAIVLQDSLLNSQMPFFPHFPCLSRPLFETNRLL
jgi:hypothetical protein